MIVADPTARPDTAGCVAGLCVPAKIVTAVGEMVNVDVSLLARLTVRSPSGAAAGTLIANEADWPSATVALDGSVI